MFVDVILIGAGLTEFTATESSENKSGKHCHTAEESVLDGKFYGIILKSIMPSNSYCSTGYQPHCDVLNCARSVLQ